MVGWGEGGGAREGGGRCWWQNLNFKYDKCRIKTELENWVKKTFIKIGTQNT